MIQSIKKVCRSFNSSTITSVIRNDIKEFPPIPFESHLSSATVKHRGLNISDPSRSPRHKIQDADKVSDESSFDTKNKSSTNLKERHNGGRIRRSHIQTSRVEEAKLTAVGGRILRVSPKTTSTFEIGGGSVVVTTSATAKYRQRHNDKTGIPSTQEIKKANPSSILIVDTEANVESDEKVIENKSSVDNSKNKISSAAVSMLLLGGGASGMVFSGVIPF